MNPNAIPAQIPHNLHYFRAKTDSAPRLRVRHATADTGFKLVGAVGIELKAMLKARKLLIPLNAKNARNS
jgi:hypothetical protein